MSIQTQVLSLASLHNFYHWNKFVSKFSNSCNCSRSYDETCDKNIGRKSSGQDEGSVDMERVDQSKHPTTNIVVEHSTCSKRKEKLVQETSENLKGTVNIKLLNKKHRA